MITLTSDFGSPYPGAMKGIVQHHTDAELCDLTHELPRQNVRAAAFWLRQLIPYWPPVVHLTVVDPGVGTDRAAIVVRADGHALVGPDNGVLLPVARELAGEDFEVFEIVEGEEPVSWYGEVPWPPDPASSTFHGRDVFAPAAGRVHELGIDSFESDVGFEPVDEYEDLTFPEPEISEGRARGTVLAIDDFGNVITNIPGDVIDELWETHAQANGVGATIRETYAVADPGHRVVTVGSHGNVELAVNRGRGDKSFGIRTGDSVKLSWVQ